MESNYYRQLSKLSGELNLANAGVVPRSFVKEYSLVGATCDQFVNTSDLKVHNYEESMKSPHCKKFLKGFEEEHDHFKKNQVWHVIPKDEMLLETKTIDTTRANKLKSSRYVRCCLNTRRFR